MQCKIAFLQMLQKRKDNESNHTDSHSQMAECSDANVVLLCFVLVIYLMRKKQRYPYIKMKPFL
jgi:hypothetical protein